MNAEYLVACCAAHQLHCVGQVGVMKARALSAEHSLPLVKVHHMEAHALVSRLHASVPFPFLCLLVSGGHNLLLLAHGVGNYTLLGTTLDDAMGARQISLTSSNRHCPHHSVAHVSADTCVYLGENLEPCTPGCGFLLSNFLGHWVILCGSGIRFGIECRFS